MGPGSSSGAPIGQRRTKIYCDKWVHEGVCAFTQQGCKYKHEMPTDKATQHQLGLFHGYPQWWKKHQQELQRQREAPLESPSSGAPSNETRSNNERYISHASSTAGNAGVRGGGLGLASGAGQELAWRPGGDYGDDPKIPRPPAIGRGVISRGVGGLRNPIGMYPNLISSNLSSDPASNPVTYIFPF
jgi:hypothetical protein